ncbi:MAG: methyl-accepting chemotaxis protein, partial [Deltaproteobacteria bacterium]|nr:methyl-accepting chemotaxis protein [Deltaproteobacteria bacterium]
IYAELNGIVDTELAPVLQSYTPYPDEAILWQSFTNNWGLYLDGIRQVEENSSANTGFYSRRLSAGASLKYWMSYEQPMRWMLERARRLDQPQAEELAYQILVCLEAIKGLQLYEKLGIQAENPEAREAALTIGRSEMARVTQSMNAMERILLNPAVSEERYKTFSETFTAAGRGKIRFGEEGTASWTQTRFDLPSDFVNPEMEEISRYYWQTIKPMRGGGTEIFNRVAKLASDDTSFLAAKILEETCMPLNRELHQALGQLMEAGRNRQGLVKTEARSATRKALNVLYIVTAAGLLLGISLAAFFTHNLDSSLAVVTHSLAEAAQEVDGATLHLKEASMAMADSALESSEAITETREQLENISQAINRNNQLASRADGVIEETIKELTDSEQSMDKVSEAMRAIHDSGQRIEKILKAINSIAFQTNLLALNAAVEASRAGEAGAGFAVVAEEVRNLAVRCADAARDSTDHIYQMVRNIDTGSSLVGTTSEKLRNTSTHISDAATLFSELAGSSKSQDESVQELKESVVKLEAATHSNSAASEETAAAAAKLHEQVDVLHEEMASLNSITHGVSS